MADTERTSIATPTDQAMAAESITCTVVICTKNRPMHLRRCLEHLRHQSIRSFDVLVIDNCPARTSAYEIALEFGARYILCPEPGLSHARNIGLYASSTDIVGFIDDDAYPDPDWLEILLSEFANPNVAAVTGRIVFEDHPEQTSARARSYACINRHSPDWFEMTNFGGVGGGMNMAFRRSVLGTWKGFEELLGRGQVLNAWEDDYAFFALVDKGFSIVHAPTARVNHPPRPEKLGKLKTFHSIAITSAYITLLSLRHPSYIPSISDFLFGAARRTPQSWKPRNRRPFSSNTPRWLVILAFLSGPFVYFFSYLSKSLRFASRSPVRAFDSAVSTEPQG